MTFCSNKWNVSPNLPMILVFLYANSRFAVFGRNVSTANYEGRLYRYFVWHLSDEREKTKLNFEIVEKRRNTEVGLSHKYLMKFTQHLRAKLEKR